MIGKLDTSGPLKGLARSRHMLLQPYFGTHQSCLWRPDLFSSRNSYILRYRHQLFKLGIGVERNRNRNFVQEPKFLFLP